MKYVKNLRIPKHMRVASVMYHAKEAFIVTAIFITGFLFFVFIIG
jgi:hypothetical protein